MTTLDHGASPLLVLVKSDNLRRTWPEWVTNLLRVYRTGCGGMRSPEWPDPAWFPQRGTVPEFGTFTGKVLVNAGTFSPPRATPPANRPPETMLLTAGLAEGGALCGTLHGSAVIAEIKARYYLLVRRIYDYTSYFDGRHGAPPEGFLQAAQDALRVALVLVVAGGTRHVSDQEIEFLTTLHMIHGLETARSRSV